MNFTQMKKGPIKATVEIQLRQFCNDLDDRVDAYWDEEDAVGKAIKKLVESTMKEWGILPRKGTE